MATSTCPRCANALKDEEKSDDVCAACVARILDDGARRRSGRARWSTLVTLPRWTGLRILASWTLTLASCALAGLIFSLAVMMSRDYGGLERYLALGALVAAASLPLFLQIWASRIGAPGALYALRRDPRAPVFLLRSFGDDRAAVVNTNPVAPWWALNAERSITFEELIYDLFSPAGPVIAIGRPGELISPLGAARLWVKDDRWQGVAEELLGECRRVVMIMGELQPGTGLVWEAERLFRLAMPEKVVFVVPPIAEPELAERWEAYRRLSNDRLPGYRGGEVAAFFDREGRCSVSRLRPAGGSSFARNEAAYRGKLPIRIPDDGRSHWLRLWLKSKAWTKRSAFALAVVCFIMVFSSALAPPSHAPVSLPGEVDVVPTVVPEPTPLILKVAEDGSIVAPDGTRIGSPDEIRNYLQLEFLKVHGGKTSPEIILRHPNSLAFGNLARLLKLCREAGFSEVSQKIDSPAPPD